MLARVIALAPAMLCAAGMKSRFALCLLLVPAAASASPGAEVQLDVLGLLEHRYAASATVAVSPDVALSIGLADAPGDGGAPATRQVSLSLPIYSHPGFRGLFLEPGLAAGATWPSVGCLGCEPFSKDISAELLVGWSWVFDSGLALATAVGAQVEVACYDDDCGAVPSVSPTGYVKLGYAF